MAKQPPVQPAELPTTREGHIDAARTWLAAAITGARGMPGVPLGNLGNLGAYPQVCAQIATAHATLALSAPFGVAETPT